jgi:hypothetical protein
LIGCDAADGLRRWLASTVIAARVQLRAYPLGALRLIAYDAADGLPRSLASTVVAARLPLRLIR